MVSADALDMVLYEINLSRTPAGSARRRRRWYRDADESPRRDVVLAIDIGGTKMAAGLMTMQGELIDRERRRRRPRPERRRAVRLARRDRPVPARAGPQPPPARPGRRSASAAPDRSARTSTRCRRLNIARLAVVPAASKLASATGAAGVRRSRRQGAGAGRGLARRGAGHGELPGDGRVDRRRRRHRAQRPAARRCVRQRRPHRAHHRRAERAALRCAGRAAASRPRRRARRSKRSPGGRRPSRPTRSCSAPGDSSAAPSPRCATCSTSTSSVVGGSVALGFGATFFNSAQEALDEHARLSFSRGARITPARLGDRGPLIGAGAVGVRGLRRAARDGGDAAVRTALDGYRRRAGGS